MRKIVGVVVITAAVGVIVGVVAVNGVPVSGPVPGATEGQPSSTEVYVASVDDPPSYADVSAADGVVPGTRGVNDSGRSYGYLDGSDIPTPDLIEVIATNGKIGYVYSADMNAALSPPPGAKPEDLAQNRSNGVKAIPVYLTDGITRIGEFPVVPATREERRDD
ncbi:hypothetical protein [Microbacterium sp.]|uniref:hypothetical protein n=1 Tax=Microbacterium sp. TaxID=51671 RepID=UPI0039E60C2B